VAGAGRGGAGSRSGGRPGLGSPPVPPEASITPGEIARIAAFERESIVRVADERVAIPEGWVARTPALPLVYFLNHVRVNVPIETDQALELLERHMSHMPYRYLAVADEPSGERLAAELRPAGWKVGRDVLMAFTGELDRGLDTTAVVDSEEADVLGLMTQWVGEDDETRGRPEMVRQVVEASRLTWRARNARHFTVRAGDGSVIGMTMLFSDGKVAQVEDVYVVAEARGRGLGRALVTHAVARALDEAHELVFIPADDEDWPKELYAKLGFTAAARRWTFHRWMSA
jgi:GNAT superfamily N-acetyltransferase